MKGWVNWLRQRSKPIHRLVQAQALDLPKFEFAIHAGTDECISRDLERDGIWEPFETTVFGRLCRPGDRVLDLGANIGWYTALAAKLVGGQGAVIAFEPDATNYRVLRHNVALADRHGVVQTINAAVSDRQGQLPFYRSESNLGDHRLFSDTTERIMVAVDVTTLDAFFVGRNELLPSIVKSDTQGSEAKILRGAAGLLAAGWRPVMVVEFWPFGLTRSGDDPMTLATELLGLGYSLYEVSEHTPRLRCLDLEAIERRLGEDISPNHWGFLNLLCIHKDSNRLTDLADLMA
ncbi:MULTISPECIES: FkbM family methyltransferase [unclassified Pseudomonas]|uniref:FkbM family methyltransferase n=1 Tax=unclassified Pseudomonas TaxID=196821 RepID=UPI00244D4835|nr:MULTISPECIES: FkbM family methyltransferase [unclassified Pseudomonas]MDG9925177.1 FkbM family methyltransferase [Pseudomonas sp. GD04045]MDH0035307.1 FkbM family methyltransferase [Pseudomonas sp. GD04019]